MIYSRMMRWKEHVARMGKRNAYRLLVGKPEGRSPLGRPKRRWVSNIKMGLREMGWDGAVWIGLAQDKEKWSSCECGNERSGFMKCWEFLGLLRNWWPLE
jgi:hypothetical protein